MSRSLMNKIVISIACIINIVMGYLSQNKYISTAAAGLVILVSLIAVVSYFVYGFIKARRGRVRNDGQ